MKLGRKLENLRSGTYIRLAGDSGAVSVEFAIVIALFFFMFLVLFDFGRIAFSQVMAEKATNIAARIAVVRPPVVCPNANPPFPTVHNRREGVVGPNYGTSCSGSSFGEICAQLTFICPGRADSATAMEIWDRVSVLLPTNASIENFTFTYESHPDEQHPEFGFLGGPFTPNVTVELNLDNYEFISPLGALSTAAGAINPALGAAFDYPVFSVSLPAEDLALGNDG